MQPVRTRDLAALFLYLGATSFGGPVAHLAYMEEAVVNRRGWITREQFLDMVGATGLIPGPNSTEVALQIGLAVGGWRGFWAVGLAFTGPAVLLSMAAAATYGALAHDPVVVGAMRGMQPVVVAILVQALWRMAPAALGGVRGWGLATGVLLLALGGVPDVALLFGAAAVGLALAVGREGRAPLAAVVASPAPGWGLLPAAAAATAPVALWPLFGVFLKTGALLFGSGYVLVAYLRADLVVDRHWLTEDQLLDAIAVGQVTPGPLSSTATFIGYVLAGPAGAILATIGIFAPAFILVALTARWIPAMRRSARWSGILDGANAASLALMAHAAGLMALGALADVPGLVVGVASLALLVGLGAPPLLPLAAGALLGGLRGW